MSKLCDLILTEDEVQEVLESLQVTITPEKQLIITPLKEIAESHRGDQLIDLVLSEDVIKEITESLKQTMSDKNQAVLDHIAKECQE
jgi:DnaJ-domain-containing protein 1